MVSVQLARPQRATKLAPSYGFFLYLCLIPLVSFVIMVPTYVCATWGKKICVSFGVLMVLLS